MCWPAVLCLCARRRSTKPACSTKHFLCMAKTSTCRTGLFRPATATTISPAHQIIHYKGESTKKGSLNYVRTFYQAMIIFTRKHLSGRRAGLFIGMLQSGDLAARRADAAEKHRAHAWPGCRWPTRRCVYGGLAYLKGFLGQLLLPRPVLFQDRRSCAFNFPLVHGSCGCWLVWLNGGYDQRYDLRRLLRGPGLGHGAAGCDLRLSRP
jgi:hypothetical protein